MILIVSLCNFFLVVALEVTKYILNFSQSIYNQYLSLQLKYRNLKTKKFPLPCPSSWWRYYLKYHIYIFWKLPQTKLYFCFHHKIHFTELKRIIYCIYPNIYQFCCSLFLMFQVSFRYYFPFTIILKQVCWVQNFLVFLHLRMFLFYFYFWKIFLLYMEFWADTSFLSALEKCCVTSLWPLRFCERESLSSNCCSPRDDASFLSSCFKNFSLSLMFQKCEYDVFG